MMMGIACTTSNPPAATRPTVREVTDDELCTMLVARMPTKRPTKGFDVNESSSVTIPPPSSFREAPKREMLKKNRYTRTGIENHRIARLMRPRMVCVASPSIFPTREFGRTPKCLLAVPFPGYRGGMTLPLVCEFELVRMRGIPSFDICRYENPDCVLSIAENGLCS
jgi:hypothetical protein